MTKFTLQDFDSLMIEVSRSRDTLYIFFFFWKFKHFLWQRVWRIALKKTTVNLQILKSIENPLFILAYI